MPDVASLFMPEPPRWGLRGDPFLWRDMRRHFAGVPLPESPEALSGLVHQAFLDLTGCPVDHPQHVLVPRYRNGGMSSGYVAPRFWTETAIPLLCQRLRSV